MDTRSGTSSPTIPHAYIIPMPGSEPNMNQNVTSTGSESSSLSTQNGNQNDMSVGSAESSSISVNNPNQSGTSTGSTQSSSTGSTQSSTTSVQRTTQSDTSSRSQSSSPSTQIDALAQIEWPPSLYLLSEKKRNHKLCLDLHKTALEGNVDEGKRLLRENSGSKVLRAAITEGLETVLHVAAGAKQTRFVEEMMKYLVEQEDMSTLLSILKLQNHKRNTAFCFAVMVGSMEIVQTMLDKDLSLLTIRGGQNMTPLYLASVFGQREIASFLYNKIRDKGANALEEILTAEDKRAIFFVSIKTTLYDLAYKLLDDQKELALAYNSDATPLHLLARTPLHLLAQTPSALTNESDKRDLSTQALELVELLWEKILDQTDVQVKEYFHEHSDLLFDAAHLGNFEFLARLIHLYPDLVHKLDEHDRSIFHIAIMHRHTKVFNLIYEIGFDKELIATYVDKYGNSLLHLAAKYPDPRPISMVPGAALEMQEELITFKEVELLVKPIYSEIKNSEGKTPRQLFTIEHANLLKQGEEWMRNTANSCMVVATLIATIVFAATFQLPGGNNQEGIPIHLRNIVFHIFAMAESIALSSSSISILMFLSILTSRYTENDFLISLPRKLVVGVSTLFISIATMMLAFISSIFLAYDKHRSDTIPLLCTIFVFVPVFIFVFVQYELFKDILYSSFRLRLSTKPRK